MMPVAIVDDNPVSDRERKWNGLGRWGMAWRTTLGASVVGILGGLTMALAWNEALTVVFVSVIFGGCIPIFLGLLSLLVSSRLRRRTLFTQSLLFGVASGVWVMLGFVLFGLILDGGLDPFFLVIVVVYCIPAVLIGGVGHALAVWSTSKRVAWAFGALWVLLVAFVTVQAVTYAPPKVDLPPPPYEGQQCVRVSEEGETLLLPCEAQIGPAAPDQVPPTER